jgi:hypothetical protein
LIVGSIKFELVVVQKNTRAFMVFRRSKPAFLYNPGPAVIAAAEPSIELKLDIVRPFW